MSIIVINAFINIEVCSFVVIYKRKIYAFQAIYLYFNVMLLQLLYY
jgi:hypothetical protein